jgi:hypothetical protein
MLAFRTELELIADYYSHGTFSITKKKAKQKTIGGFFDCPKQTFYQFCV